MTDETNTPNENENQLPSEMELLRGRADQLGIAYHPNIGLDKLRAKVEAKMNPPTATSFAAPVKQVEISAEQAQEDALKVRDARMRRAATKLVRIRVTCMNPNKKEHEGEVFTVSNSVVGTIKKYVPFNNDAGWHVPAMILQMMKERKCQIFYTVKNDRGQKVRKGKLINEFAIEVLDQLTETEIADLAKQQAVAHRIDP